MNTTKFDLRKRATFVQAIQGPMEKRDRRYSRFTRRFESNMFWKFMTVLLTICQLLNTVTGFHFYLHAGETRCFGENAIANTKVLIEYTVSTGSGIMPVNLRVSFPSSGAIKKPVLAEENNVEHGKVAFVIPFPDDKDEYENAIKAAMHRRKRAKADLFKALKENDGKLGEVHKNRGANRRLLSVESGMDRKADAHVDEKVESVADHGHLALEEHEHGDKIHDVDPNVGRRGGANHGHGYGHGHGRYGHGHHDVGGNIDEDDYDDIDDDFEDLDMDEYDGIDDRDLDEAQIRNTRRFRERVGREAHLDDEDFEDGDFESQRFEICVWNKEYENDAKRRRVRLVIHKGDSAHDYTRLAKKEHMTQLEVSLQQISKELQQLMRELDRAHRLESKVMRLNQRTNGQVKMMSIVALSTMIGVGFFQSIYTKRFFKRKKIL